jgi:hypothetical protein
MTSSTWFGHEEDRARDYIAAGRRRLKELGAAIRKRRRLQGSEAAIRKRRILRRMEVLVTPRDFILLKQAMRSAELRPWEQRRVEYLTRKLD